jgi:hypothetical protein
MTTPSQPRSIQAGNRGALWRRMTSCSGSSMGKRSRRLRRKGIRRRLLRRDHRARLQPRRDARPRRSEGPPTTGRHSHPLYAEPRVLGQSAAPAGGDLAAVRRELRSRQTRPALSIPGTGQHHPGPHPPIHLLDLQGSELLRTRSVPVWNFPVDRLVCRVSRSLAPDNVYIGRGL